MSELGSGRPVAADLEGEQLAVVVDDGRGTWKAACHIQIVLTGASICRPAVGLRRDEAEDVPAGPEDEGRSRR